MTSTISMRWSVPRAVAGNVFLLVLSAGNGSQGKELSDEPMRMCSPASGN
jgi:hypothetical protein